MDLWLIGFVAVASFLAGSIPFGYLIGIAVFRTDIRSVGSGNIGAANALRTFGKAGALAVLLLDAVKGYLPVHLVLTYAHRDTMVAAAIAATCAVLGHCFSPWLRWKGGKGVATSFGAIAAFSWKALGIVVAVWLCGALLTQYSSVGSLLGNIAAPFALWLTTGAPPAMLYGTFAALFIAWTHRENIARLRAGTEHRLPLFRRSGS